MTPGTTSPPNIVFVFVDNLGFGELGCYGGGVLRGAPTPRIDAFASEGLRLTNMNMEAQCTPSRSAVMTGRLPIRSGTTRIPLPGSPSGLVTWERTIGELLQAEEYATGHFGKWHLGSIESRHPQHRGFDEWWGLLETHDSSLWSEAPGYDPSVVPPAALHRRRRNREHGDGVNDRIYLRRASEPSANLIGVCSDTLSVAELDVVFDTSARSVIYNAVTLTASGLEMTTLLLERTIDTETGASFNATNFHCTAGSDGTELTSTRYEANGDREEVTTSLIGLDGPSMTERVIESYDTDPTEALGDWSEPDRCFE